MQKMSNCQIEYRNNSYTIVTAEKQTYIAALRFEEVDEARNEAGVDDGCGDADGRTEREELRLR